MCVIARLLAAVQTGKLQATPLELPELEDLEPLLLNLPDSSSDAGEAESGEQQQQAPRPPRYPELQFLRAMLQLQQALQDVHRCQQPLQTQQEPPGGKAGSKGDSRAVLPAEVSQQQAAALQTAYARLRQPVRDLLLTGLAPAALQLPLLLLIAPLLESAYMPFSRADVMGLLRVMGSVSTGLPSFAAAVLEGSHGSLPGVTWPDQLAEKTGPDAAAVNAARLALCRGLARAHVLGSSIQAW